MQTIQIPAGSTSKSVFVQVRTVADNVLQLGQDYTTLPFIVYARDGELADVAASVELATSASPWTSAGVVMVGFGVYRIDVPDAWLASGADRVAVTLTDNFTEGSATMWGTVNIELTNVPTAFSGAAKRDVRSR